MYLNIPYRLQNKELIIQTPLKSYPQSYLAYIEAHGAGYLQNWLLPSPEPSRDGLDYVRFNHFQANTAQSGIARLGDATLTPDYNLPNYYQIFSQLGYQLFAFDQDDGIFYLDIETDQIMQVAESFKDLLTKLQTGPTDDLLPNLDNSPDFEEMSYFSNYYIQSGNQYFALVENSKELIHGLEYYQDFSDKEWYLGWVKHFINHDQKDLAEIANDALDFQKDFFRLDIKDYLDIDGQII